MQFVAPQARHSRSPFAVRRSQISERPHIGRVAHRGAIIMVARFLRTARNAIPYSYLASWLRKPAFSIVTLQRNRLTAGRCGSPGETSAEGRSTDRGGSREF